MEGGEYKVWHGVGGEWNNFKLQIKFSSGFLILYGVHKNYYIKKALYENKGLLNCLRAERKFLKYFDFNKIQYKMYFKRELLFK